MACNSNKNFYHRYNEKIYFDYRDDLDAIYVDESDFNKASELSRVFNTANKGAIYFEQEYDFRFSNAIIIGSNYSKAFITEIESQVKVNADKTRVIQLTKSGQIGIFTNRIIAKLKTPAQGSLIDEIFSSLPINKEKLERLKLGKSTTFELPNKMVIPALKLMSQSKLFKYSDPEIVFPLEQFSPSLINISNPLDNSLVHEIIGSDIAHESGNDGSSDIKIAILDVGFMTTHQEFKDNVSLQRSTHSFSNDAKAYDPSRDHGTQMAGIIASQPNTSGDNVTGICPNCKIILIKYTENHGNLARVIESLQDDISIFYTSVWHHSMNDPNIRSELEDLAKNGRSGKGVPIVMAIGNSNQEYEENDIRLQSFVTSVSGSTAGDEFKFKYKESTNISFVAPAFTFGTSDLDNDIDKEDSYTITSRTSAASAIVAGVIGLIMAKNSKLSRKTILEILKQSAKKIPQANGTQRTVEYVNGYSEHTGFGRIDANVVSKPIVRKKIGPAGVPLLSLLCVNGVKSLDVVSNSVQQNSMHSFFIDPSHYNFITEFSPPSNLSFNSSNLKIKLVDSLNTIHIYDY